MRLPFKAILGLGVLMICGEVGVRATEYLYANNPASSTNAWYPASSTFYWPRWKFVIYNASSNVVFSGNGGQVNAGARYKAWQGATFEYPPNYTVIYISYSNTMAYTAYTNIQVGNDAVVDFALPEIGGAGGGGGCTNVTVWVSNPFSDMTVVGRWYYNGILAFVENIGALQKVAKTYCLLSGDTFLATMTWLNSDVILNINDLTNATDFTVTNFLVEVGVDGTTNYPTSGLNPTEMWNKFQTNSWVDWTGATNTLLVEQAGFNRVVDSAETGNELLTRILGAIQGLGNGTNASFDTSSITSQIAALHYSITNGISLTNDINGGRTNMVGDLANFSNRLASVVGGLGSATSSATGALSAIAMDLEPGDIGTAMTVNMVGHTWDFNPLHNADLSALFGLARKLFTYILTAAYFIAVTARIRDVVKVLGTAQQGTVPNVIVEALGFGGNWGVALAPVILVLILAVLAFGCAWATNMITGMVSGEVMTTLTTNPLGGYSGAILAGIDLAKNFFPFTKAVALFSAYCIWYVMTIYIIAWINAGMRLIWGS